RQSPHCSTGLSSQGPDEEQKEGEHEQGRQDRENLAPSSSERLHPAKDGSRCRDTHRNIRRSSGNTGEEQKERL
ncbi:hypothetical protein LEMLEM_LOCUS6503, partial [Lemmus lemmus]